MQFLDTLNPEQREAVLHINGPLLILAGAGSGQDARHHQPHRVSRRRRPRAAERSARGHVHEQGGRGDARARRVAARLGRAAGMWVSTFHSLCARLLRREAPAIGLSRDFVIYDSSDQLTVVKQALKELHIDDSFMQPRAALSRISHAKNRMERPGADGRRAPAGTGATSRSPRSTRYYLNALKESNALDFDDLLLQDGRPVRAVRARAREVRAAVPLRDGRRVPGHQPPAVPADPAARRGAPQPLRRRRSRSVDLQVARRRPAQHPRLRAGLSAKRRSSSSSATTARRRSSSTPRRPSSARTATARTSISGPTARAAPASSTSAAATSSRRPTSSPGRPAPRWPTTSRRRSRCCTAPTRSRARSKTR